MSSIYLLIDKTNSIVGKAVSWLTFILVIIICSDVVMRYLFNTTKAWIIELEWHLFALVFLLGAAYALQKDQHVRVDVFYARFSKRKKAWINLLGSIFFLLPWCFIVIYTSFQYADNSFAIGETSADPGGLPARYIIKFAITLGFFMLLLQAISLIIKSILTIISKETKVWKS